MSSSAKCFLFVFPAGTEMYIVNVFICLFLNHTQGFHYFCFNYQFLLVLLLLLLLLFVYIFIIHIIRIIHLVGIYIIWIAKSLRIVAPSASVINSSWYLYHFSQSNIRQYLHSFQFLHIDLWQPVIVNFVDRIIHLCKQKKAKMNHVN